MSEAYWTALAILVAINIGFAAWGVTWQRNRRKGWVAEEDFEQ